MDRRRNLYLLPIVLVMTATLGCKSFHFDNDGQLAHEEVAQNQSESESEKQTLNTEQHQPAHARVSDQVSGLVGDVASTLPPPPAPTLVTLATHQDQSTDRLPASRMFEIIEDLKTESTFSQIVDATSGVVLVDFYADWCGPCRKQSKVLHDLEKVASEADSQIVKVDIDAHPRLARKYNVTSLPTLVVIKDGEVVQRKVGLTKRAQLAAMLR